MRRRSTAGVTLMELLIAVLLLSLLSVGLLFALRIGLNAYSKTQTRLMDNRRVAGAQRILEQELEGHDAGGCAVRCGSAGRRRESGLLPGRAANHAAGFYLLATAGMAGTAADSGGFPDPGRRWQRPAPGGE